MNKVDIFSAGSTVSQWELVSDQVMGGRSSGNIDFSDEGVRLSGRISAENNGGFVKIRWPINDSVLKSNLAQMKGVWFVAKSEGSSITQVMLKSSQLWMPWQSYRATIQLTCDWQEFFIPFEQFQPYRTQTSLNPVRINQFSVLLGQLGEQSVLTQKFGFYAL